VADPKDDAAGTETPRSVADAVPKVVRSFDEMNTGAMVFELQGTVGELKQAIVSLQMTLEGLGRRIDGTERTSSDIKTVLTNLVPKIEDLAGFVKHGAPSLATKDDVADLQTEIEKRPTRRQAILDIAWVVGLIAAAVTLGSRVAH
jgi:hypothetical protein